MRILYLQNIRLPTEKAHGIQIMETCAAFAAAGHEVTLVVSSWRSGDEASIFAYYGLPKTFSIEIVSNGGLLFWKSIGFVAGSFIFALNARRLARSGEFDVIYTRDDILVRRGYFYEMHDVRRGYFQRRALKNAAGVVCITEGLAEYCRKSSVRPDKILVAPDGVDLSKFDVSESRQDCRAKLRLLIDKKIVLYSGHLYEWKGAHVLAEAATFLPDDVKTIFVGGNDTDTVSFKAHYAADSDPESSKVIVLGRKPHEIIPYYLKAADVLVLPNSAREDISRLYTSPMKLFEYMASGTPIVATDLPSIREILNNGNSILCAPDDPKALASAISKMLSDEVLSQKLAIRASADVKRYTWDKRASAIAEFIGCSRKTKGRDFYNKESAHYSSKRYPEYASDYVQFFFKKRLDIALKTLEGAINDKTDGKTGLSLLEIGCADGVVTRAISKNIPNAFSEMTGIDTAEEMIRVAEEIRNYNFEIRSKSEIIDSKSDGIPQMRYFVRGREPANARFDAVIEMGVANYTDFDAELRYAADHLKSGGIYILSIAGKGSVNARLGGAVGYANFLSYREYEQRVQKAFSIEKSVSVGLRLPLLWRMPACARVVQPMIEGIVRPFAPSLFHERVYILKKKL